MFKVDENSILEQLIERWKFLLKYLNSVRHQFYESELTLTVLTSSLFSKTCQKELLTLSKVDVTGGRLTIINTRM